MIAVYTSDMVEMVQTMKEHGKAFAAQASTMAPLSWAQGEISATAALSDHMEAADFRAVSDGKYMSAVKNFRACILAP